jgi:hypothetical protein
MAEKVLGEDKKYLTRYVKKMTQDTYNEVLQVILSYYASTGSQIPATSRCHTVQSFKGLC